MRKTTIAEACTLHARIGWQGLTKKEYLDEGNYYLVTGVDFDNGHIAFDSCHYVTKDRYDQDQHIQLHMDDILVTKDGTIGKVAIIDEPIEKPATLNSGVFVVRPKDKASLLPKYLMYVLQSNHFNSFIERIKVGCTIAHLNQEKFYQFEFPLPPVDDQEKIIKVFDTMFSVLYARKLEIQKLDELIKARFVELFGDPVANSMKWPVKKLKDLSIQINSGNTPKGGSENYVEDGITFFRSQNVWKDRLEMDDIVYIDAETHARMKRSSLKHGDILMTKTGRINTENSSLGRAALYDGEDDMANVNGHVYFIRLKEGVNNKFILRILVSPEYRDLIRSVCVGGIDKRQLNKEHIEDFPIICPPSDMVDDYVTFVDQVDKSKIAVQKALDEAQLLFASLMQEYFG